MRIAELSQNPLTFTCRSFLLWPERNRIEDINTRIAPDIDHSMLAEVETLSPVFGKRPAEQIIFTHNHFDHAVSTAISKRDFGTKGYAWCEDDDVDEILYNGQQSTVGYNSLQALYPPGHSPDSICLFCQHQKMLFSGYDPPFFNNVCKTILTTLENVMPS